MPLESPILDDLQYKTLEASLRNQIPIYAPEWTDHNDSDPGITMLQLFSYLAEQIGYRLNQVPEKNYIEFLKMIGIRLRPAEPATTLMNFILTKPETLEQFLIPAASRIKAKTDSGEPPVFETDNNLDVVPAQLATLVSTRSNTLTQINALGETGPGAGDPDSYIEQRYSLAWDGKTPKLKDMPVSPVGLFQRPSEKTHQHLWIGLAFNPASTAGFLGARVTLSLQLDDDEQPEADAVVQCGEPELELAIPVQTDGNLVSYRYYRPPQIGEVYGSWQTLAVIGDDTQGWTRSGKIRFDVPSRMGAIPNSEWQDVETGLPHPLVGALKNPVTGAPDFVPVSGWIHVQFNAVSPALTLRALSFNVTQATNAQTVRGEQLGRGTGEPGQRFQLSHGNVLQQTLEVQTVNTGPDQQRLLWNQVAGFDSTDPFALVYALDPESGELVFGDGVRGRPPQETERVIATVYRYGGGESGEVTVGMVNKPDSLPTPVEAATNVVAASGGKDAETTDEAKLRAPVQLTVQQRAVTKEDFEFHALQTKGVRVARAEVVPLYIPYPVGSLVGQGLDLQTRVPGAVTVLVVPDQDGAYPTPTEGMLRTVCHYLDQYRLITTEVYTAAPQYVRIHNFLIDLKAEPGFTRTQLREAIARQLETYFHVLTGGEDGDGFPFGATIHHADLVAQVFKVSGVARVENLQAWYDGHSPAGVVPSMSWRIERDTARRLTNCPENDTDDTKLELKTDENVFIDSTTLDIRITGV